MLRRLRLRGACASAGAAPATAVRAERRVRVPPDAVAEARAGAPIPPSARHPADADRRARAASRRPSSASRCAGCARRRGRRRLDAERHRGLRRRARAEAGRRRHASRAGATPRPSPRDRPSYAASAPRLGRGGHEARLETRLALPPRRLSMPSNPPDRLHARRTTHDPRFHRIRRLPPYVFEEVNRLKAAPARRGRRHHRLRHGQSRHADAQAHRRQADRDGARPQVRPLFGLQGHPRACAGPWPATTTAASA